MNVRGAGGLACVRDVRLLVAFVQSDLRSRERLPSGGGNRGKSQDQAEQFGYSDGGVTAHESRAAAQQQQGNHGQRKANATSGGEDVDDYRHAP